MNLWTGLDAKITTLSGGESRLPWHWQSEYDLSPGRQYSAETGLYDGPLTVIVDRETGSAAELFAGQLQHWAGATEPSNPSS